jgi:hypothetical protein
VGQVHRHRKAAETNGSGNEVHGMVQPLTKTDLDLGTAFQPFLKACLAIGAVEGRAQIARHDNWQRQIGDRKFGALVRLLGEAADE